MVTVNKEPGDDYWRVWRSGAELSKHQSKGAAVTAARREASDWDDYIEISGPRGGHERIDLKGQHGDSGGLLGGSFF